LRAFSQQEEKMRISGETKNQATQQATSTNQRLADLTTIGWLSLIDPVNNVIIGTMRNDTLSAQAEGDLVFGLAGDDDLSSAFNRTGLIGGRGHDALTTEVIIPVQGSEPVHGLAIQIGGAGNDALDATVTLQGVDFQQRDLSIEVLLDGGDGNDVINAVANLVIPTFGNVTATTRVLGGRGDDIINAVADTRGAGLLLDNFAMNSVDGGSGDDHIRAQAETDLQGFFATAINVLDGGDGNDVLEASARGRSNVTEMVSNSLDGGRGDDVLRAFNLTDSNGALPVGINELWGDDGNDVLEATHSTDGENGITDVTNRLDGGKGNDSVTANATALGGRVLALNHLEGGDGRDTLTARLDAGALGGVPPVTPDLYDVSNVLNGGSGNDRLEAVLSVRASPGVTDDSRAVNRLDGGSGNDTLMATVVPGTFGFLIDSPAENRLDGGSGNDILVATVAPGAVGASFLNGGSGNDQLTVIGGSENILEGGEGKDTLAGGIGNDDLMGEGGADRFVFAPQSGSDTVDFEKGQDIIDLRPLAAVISSFANLDIEVVGQNSVIHFDNDDDLTVLGVTNLSANDFWFA
jgi:Ca2+-binding RTX toxin-like protein